MEGELDFRFMSCKVCVFPVLATDDNRPITVTQIHNGKLWACHYARQVSWRPGDAASTRVIEHLWAPPLPRL
jgi:hypothetical protein